jgi:hypothetical protein
MTIKLDCSYIIKEIGKQDKNIRERILNNPPQMPLRGWLLYLTANHPTSIKEIQKKLGYKGAALYHVHEGLPLLDWMTKNGYLNVVGKRGREFLFISSLVNKAKAVKT